MNNLTTMLPIGIDTERFNYYHCFIDHFGESKLFMLMDKALAPDVTTITTNIKKGDISLTYENISQVDPVSVPARFSVILYNRFIKFNGNANKGLTIVTPFLADDDLKRLEAFIIEQAHFNYFDPRFIDWIEHCNYFSNTPIN